eukprot:Gb_28006 [translate_table: standard]
MWSLQRNLSNGETGQVLYETMFVWNEFLTRGIRHCLNNTLWTVALVYGFFKQAKLSISGKYFSLTLIARRSRHYAGTRYLKRGVNDKGRVANDVETEQIVFEDVSEGCLWQISSVVQHRGSIPLFWSQETSRLNIKPDIILQKKDPTYQATRLHFENLAKRYGNPIIVLNLIKTYEKKPREATLCAEFANAVELINRDLSEANHLKFIHWDFHKFSRRKSANVLQHLAQLASEALDLTGFYCSQITSDLKIEKKEPKNNLKKDAVINICSSVVCDDFHNGLRNMCTKIANTCDSGDSSRLIYDKELERKPFFQIGVLRTNCIDCLDRTNVAQYAYGLAALGRQLHALGLIDVPEIDPDTSLAESLMGLYETMGDTLALQYGGSAAHNKVFSERRGRWKAATHSQEFFRALQRYYSNAYMDAEKQDAINVFLGHFQPQQGKPALWELDSDQHCNIGQHVNSFVNETTRSSFKRSLSDGNILMQIIAAIPTTPVARQTNLQVKISLSERSLEEEASSCLCDTTPENQRTSSNGISYLRRNHYSCSNDKLTQSGKQGILADGSCNPNLNDMDWFSSSGNSCEEDACERCLVTSALKTDSSCGSDIIDSPMEISDWKIECDQGSESINQMEKSDQTSIARGQSKGTSHTKSALEQIQRGNYNLGETIIGEVPTEFSSSFIQWVCHGQTLCH